MAVQFFAPKTLGSLTIGAGALTGGGAIYWYQMPRTWKELLVKEGFLFLSTEDDYKGMFNDQKENSDWKTETDLKDSKETDVKDKAEKYCKKLDETLPESSSANYENDKKKLIAFCTTDGINTVKARLIQSKKTNWIGENDADEKWKTVFAVYRYNSEFIDWLKQDNESNKDLSKNSKVEEGHSKLKTACKNLLEKNYRGVDENHIKYGSWWCVDPGYTTIKEKIQKSDEGWTEKNQGDSDWNKVTKEWKDTVQVKKWANKASGGSDDNAELTDDSLKKLCETKNVTAKLSEEESYQEKYIVIKSVCKSSSS